LDGGTPEFKLEWKKGRKAAENKEGSISSNNTTGKREIEEDSEV